MKKFIIKSSKVLEWKRLGTFRCPQTCLIKDDEAKSFELYLSTNEISFSILDIGTRKNKKKKKKLTATKTKVVKSTAALKPVKLIKKPREIKQKIETTDEKSVE